MVTKLEGPQFSKSQRSHATPSRYRAEITVAIMIALCLLVRPTDAGSGGWVMFAPTPELESAFGEKLKQSPESVIHASAKEFDYIHYGYVSAQTKAKLFIAYYTFASAT